MKVLIIDYGIGNLHSVRRALENIGADVAVSDSPKELAAAARIILPGVGGFGAGMAQLEERGWVEPFRRAVVDDGVPCLGICLGMQLLADRGFEGEERPGLGVIPGDVIRLEPQSKDERVPHVGWNEVSQSSDSPLFSGIQSGTDFYFVHSYHLKARDERQVIGTTNYCGSFPAAVQRENVFGVQFHPEKSSHAGVRLLRNFLALS